MRAGVIAAAALVAALPLGTSANAQDQGTPYWASISSGKANMRTGPGRTYPAVWLYQRKDLPVRVHQRYDNWRRIEGPGGAEGWMAVALLSERRTGMVMGEEPADIHAQPDGDSAVVYRVEPGVVGRISECNGNWCRISIEVGRKQRSGGWIVQGALWGVDEGEVIDD